MFSTWDRYPAAAGRRLREVAHPKRHDDAMGDFLTSVDVLIYVIGGALAASVIAIVFG
jgi:hypothetical protein